MGGEVEDADVRVTQQRVEIVSDARVREMGVAARAGALEIARANGDDVEAIARVSLEMRCADPARADERDRLLTVARHWRTIGKLRRLDLRRSLGDQSIIVLRRFRGLPRLRPAHGSRASVRRSWAESAAVSTMR